MKYCDNNFASSTYRLIDTSTMDPLLDSRDKTEVFILHRYSVIVNFLYLVSWCGLCNLFQVVEKKKSPLYPDLKDEDGENEREMLNSDGKVWRRERNLNIVIHRLLWLYMRHFLEWGLLKFSLKPTQSTATIIASIIDRCFAFYWRQEKNITFLGQGFIGGDY